MAFAVIQDNDGNRQPTANAAAERRALRGQYRALSTLAQESKDKLSSANCTDLQDALRQVDLLHKRVEKPKEHAVDSEIFKQLTEYGLDMAKKTLRNSQGRAAVDFISCLKANYVQSERPQQAGQTDSAAFDWALLGSKVSTLSLAAPGCSCLLGPLDAEPKARRVARPHHEKKALGTAVCPMEVQGANESESQQTDRNMEQMWEHLKNYQEVTMAQLVCNHSSFSQTVENIFTLSFLVRDQRVELLQRDNGLTVKPVSKNKQGNPGQPPIQFIMDFTMDDWAFMKTMISPKECILPNRKL